MVYKSKYKPKTESEHKSKFGFMLQKNNTAFATAVQSNKPYKNNKEKHMQSTVVDTVVDTVHVTVSVHISDTVSVRLVATAH